MTNWTPSEVLNNPTTDALKNELENWMIETKSETEVVLTLKK